MINSWFVFSLFFGLINAQNYAEFSYAICGLQYDFYGLLSPPRFSSSPYDENQYAECYCGATNNCVITITQDEYGNTIATDTCNSASACQYDYTPYTDLIQQFVGYFEAPAEVLPSCSSCDSVTNSITCNLTDSNGETFYYIFHHSLNPPVPTTNCATQFSYAICGLQYDFYGRLSPPRFSSSAYDENQYAECYLGATNNCVITVIQDEYGNTIATDTCNSASACQYDYTPYTDLIQQFVAYWEAQASADVLPSCSSCDSITNSITCNLTDSNAESFYYYFHHSLNPPVPTASKCASCNSDADCTSSDLCTTGACNNNCCFYTDNGSCDVTITDTVTNTIITTVPTTITNTVSATTNTVTITDTVPTSTVTKTKTTTTILSTSTTTVPTTITDTVPTSTLTKTKTTTSITSTVTTTTSTKTKTTATVTVTVTTS